MTELNNNPIDTPVLLIIFNRPDTTQRVFEAIRAVRPRKLLVAADGPRSHKLGEAEKCEQTRAITENIDWDCDVHRHYSDVNQGCRRGVISAIDWAFELTEQVIILEDDCLPHSDFFSFCQHLLTRYADDHRVMQITGTNLLDTWKDKVQSYHFSYSGCIWGWATWKRAWNYYDVDMKLLSHPEAHERLKDVVTGEYEYQRRISHWQQSLQNQVDTWDYQWDFTRFVQSGLCIVPAKNLIVNLGFGHQDATHTDRARTGLEHQKTHTLTFPLRDNSYLIVDRDYDRAILPVILPKTNRVVNGTKKILKSVFKALFPGHFQASMQ